MDNLRKAVQSLYNSTGEKSWMIIHLFAYFCLAVNYLISFAFVPIFEQSENCNAFISNVPLHEAGIKLGIT